MTDLILTASLAQLFQIPEADSVSVVLLHEQFDFGLVVLLEICLIVKLSLRIEWLIEGVTLLRSDDVQHLTALLELDLLDLIQIPLELLDLVIKQHLDLLLFASLLQLRDAHHAPVERIVLVNLDEVFLAALPEFAD